VVQLSSKNTLFEIEKIMNRIELLSIPNYKIEVTQFGAKGDSVTNFKLAFQ